MNPKYEESGMEERTTIPCSPRTREAFKALKRGGQTYDDLLMEIMDYLTKTGFDSHRFR